MIERDDELRKTLAEWKAPAPQAELDARVWRSVREIGTSRRRRWLPVAAGVVFAAGTASLWMAHRGAAPHEIRLETRADAGGFRPLPDGAITVIGTGEKQ